MAYICNVGARTNARQAFGSQRLSLQIYAIVFYFRIYFRLYFRFLNIFNTAAICFLNAIAAAATTRINTAYRKYHDTL